VARIVALVPDLMFASRIAETLRPAGYAVDFVDDVAALKSALEPRPSLALLDLHAGASAEEVVNQCRQQDVPVIAFGRHTEPALLREARQAGCVEVVARSTFVEEMQDLVGRNLSPDVRQS
jgi:CheY-like chemotaxis protein